MQNQYNSNEFMNFLYQEALPKDNLLSCDQSKMEYVKQEALKKVKEVLGLQKIEEKLKTELSYSQEDSFRTENILVKKYKVEGINKLCMPVYQLNPPIPNGKTVLYLHGHDRFGALGAIQHLEEEPYHKWLPLIMAGEGYQVFIPELLGFGEAVMENYPAGEEGKGECYPNSVELLACGYNMTGFRVFQAMRTLDFMEEFGAGGAAVFGVSGGGLVSTFLGVVDSRVKAMMNSCYLNTYQDSILAREHCIDNYIPGMLSIGESYEVLALFVPKPLLAIPGLYDTLFPIQGTREAYSYIGDVYKRYGAEESFKGIVFEGKHEISVPHVMEWLNNHR